MQIYELQVFMWALDIMERQHRGQHRRVSNDGYIHHCLRVSSAARQYQCQPEVVVAALLHDVIKDTNMTEAQLRRAFTGVGPERLTTAVVDLVVTVTKKKKGHSAASFYEAIANSTNASQLKMIDRTDNMLEMSRWAAGASAKDRAWMEAYFTRTREQMRVIVPVVKASNPPILAEYYASIIELGEALRVQ